MNQGFNREVKFKAEEGSAVSKFVLSNPKLLFNNTDYVSGNFSSQSNPAKSMRGKDRKFYNSCPRLTD